MKRTSESIIENTLITNGIKTCRGKCDFIFHTPALFNGITGSIQIPDPLSNVPPSERVVNRLRECVQKRKIEHKCPLVLDGGILNFLEKKPKKRR